MKKWTKVLAALVAVLAIGTLAACGAKKHGVKTYVAGVTSDQQKEIW